MRALSNLRCILYFEALQTARRQHRCITRKHMFYTSPLLQKSFSPIWIMFQKNTFKLVFFDGVARTFPTHKDMGVGRGAGIW